MSTGMKTGIRAGFHTLGVCCANSRVELFYSSIHAAASMPISYLEVCVANFT